MRIFFFSPVATGEMGEAAGRAQRGGCFAPPRRALPLRAGLRPPRLPRWRARGNGTLLFFFPPVATGGMPRRGRGGCSPRSRRASPGCSSPPPQRGRCPEGAEGVFLAPTVAGEAVRLSSSSPPPQRGGCPEGAEGEFLASPATGGRSLPALPRARPPCAYCARKRMALRVAVPTRPSATRAWARWKAITAAWVTPPKMPSMVPTV
jgi:hypothetical protein